VKKGTQREKRKYRLHLAACRETDIGGIEYTGLVGACDAPVGVAGGEQFKRACGAAGQRREGGTHREEFSHPQSRP